ncbi:hypothetical protein [Phytoactinopolyspora limicola]|nr:hypothetical protein [Phytoactinopolyspora limicola]
MRIRGHADGNLPVDVLISMTAEPMRIVAAVPILSRSRQHQL